MKKINLAQKDTIHFIGIGGIGMSGLAQVMKNMGFKIQGSDQAKNKNTNSCLKSGIKIFIGHSVNNLKKATIVVKSTAIKNNNIELKFAKKKQNSNIFKSRSFSRRCIIKKKYYYNWFARQNYNNILSSKDIVGSKIRSNYN